MDFYHALSFSLPFCPVFVILFVLLLFARYVMFYLCSPPPVPPLLLPFLFAPRLLFLFSRFSALSSSFSPLVGFFAAFFFLLCFRGPSFFAPLDLPLTTFFFDPGAMVGPSQLRGGGVPDSPPSHRRIGVQALAVGLAPAHRA